jgi:hypothetical protein
MVKQHRFEIHLIGVKPPKNGLQHPLKKVNLRNKVGSSKSIKNDVAVFYKAKLVNITPITIVFDTYNYSIAG